jgi:polar amino acid transport system substrate-binding protein
MRRSFKLAAIAMLVLFTASASHSSEPLLETKTALAPTGKLRVGVYTGNPLSVLKDPVSGEMKGVAFDLGREMARRVGVPFEPVVYSSVAALLEGNKSDQWDIAFYLVSPARTKDVDFTPSLVDLELGYLVPQSSSILTLSDIERLGAQVAVSEKGQADVTLSRVLKNAVLIRAPGLAAVVALVKSGKADAVAANKAILFEISDQLPGSRILEGRFETEQLAMAVPKGRPAAAFAYAQQFVEDRKSDGFVKAAMERAGVRGAVVAAPHK